MKRIIPPLLILLLLATAAHADELARYFGAGGSALISFLVNGSAVSTANPIPITQASTAVSQANITSIAASPVAASTTVTLTAASKIVDIYTSADCDIIHVNWSNGTATTDNAAIYPGGTYRYEGTAISAFKVIGEGTAGEYNVVAK
jgi:hypothetical protein